jgi:hypothetical protein
MTLLRIIVPDDTKLLHLGLRMNITTVNNQQHLHPFITTFDSHSKHTESQILRSSNFTDSTQVPP